MSEPDLLNNLLQELGVYIHVKEDGKVYRIACYGNRKALEKLKEMINQNKIKRREK